MWTGTEMIVWGGAVHEYREDTQEDRVAEEHDEAVPVEDAEAPAEADAAAEGEGKARKQKRKRDRLVQLATGARYDPATDTWQPMSTRDAPTAREDHVAVWTGRDLLVWGAARARRCSRTGRATTPARIGGIRWPTWGKRRRRVGITRRCSPGTK